MRNPDIENSASISFILSFVIQEDEYPIGYLGDTGYKKNCINPFLSYPLLSGKTNIQLDI